MARGTAGQSLRLSGLLQTPDFLFYPIKGSFYITPGWGMGRGEGGGDKSSYPPQHPTGSQSKTVTGR